MSDATVEARARRVAKRHGHIARKSRWRRDSCDNFGDFMLIEAARNICIGGPRFDMTAEQVIDYFTE